MKTKQVVHLQIRRGLKTSYLVLLSKNVLAPEPGSWITAREAQNLIDDGVTVVVKGERQR